MRLEHRDSLFSEFFFPVCLPGPRLRLLRDGGQNSKVTTVNEIWEVVIIIKCKERHAAQWGGTNKQTGGFA